MSGDAQPTYMVDVDYPGVFCPYQNPALLNYVAAAAGFPGRALADGFDYLELGCGRGVTTNVMAAASPQGRFCGVDLNQTDIAAATREAADCGLTNVRFIASGFAEAPADELPQADFIAVHGVYSWVPRETRRDIRNILATKLRPGGIAYVMYGAKPGRAAVEPLRRLLVEYVDQAPGDLLTRVEAGLRYLCGLRDGEARYFARNPAAAEALTAAFNTGTEFAAHEFLNASWEPRYFVDVAREMAEQGLTFAGQAITARNDLDLMLPDALKGLVREFADPLLVEQAKDYALDAGVRVDVYVKADAPVPDAQRGSLFDHMFFGTVEPLNAIAREGQFPPGRLALTGSPYDELLGKLAVVAHGMAELRALPEFDGRDPSRLVDALHYLVAAGQVAPCATGSRFDAAAAPGGSGPQFAMGGGYNRHRIDGVRGAETRVLLASPTLGTGIEASPLVATMLQVLTSVGTHEVPGSLSERIVATGLADRIEGWPRDDVRQQMPHAAGLLADFLQDQVIKYLDLGIVTFAR
jgi:SAM-dependent methyltransferase